MLKPFKQNLSIAFFYALYGPPLGGLLFILFIAATDSSTSNFLGTLLLSILVAYILGVVPAFITGLILSFCPFQQLKKHLLSAALTGFLTTNLFIIVVDYSAAAIATFGIPGALSAAILSFLTYQKSRKQKSINPCQPNISS